MSPATAQVSVGLTAKFTATVSGNSNTAVTWKVNGKTNGNSTYGTITDTGVYTAPTSVPSGSVTITAVSQADSNAAGQASVTVLASAGVAVSPAAVSIATGTTQQFSATINGSTSSAITWSINGISGGNSTVGTIDANGLYTAPLTPPSGGSVTVTATSTADSTQSASSSVSVLFGVGALKGQYAFLLRGTASGKNVGRVGSIVADGEGNITSGIEDVNTGSSVSTIIINSGTYTVGADGRGTLALTNNTAGTITFYISVVSNTLAYLVETDSGVTSASGELRLQDSSKFSVSSISGAYVFDFAGSDVNGYPESLIGRFVSDAGGHLTQGLVDINDNSTNSSASSFTGSSYQLDSTYGSSFGRGTSSIDGLNYAFYVVDGSRIEMLQTDSSEVTTGEAVAQASPPTSLSALSGNFTFSELGAGKSSSSSSGNPIVRAGVFKMDGTGNLANILMFQDSGGTALHVPSTGTDTGTYTLDSSGSGRGTATFTDSKQGSFQFVFYFISANQAVFQDQTKTLILDGELYAQTTTSSISQSTLAGNYAFLWSANNNGRMDYSGRFALTSASSGNVKGTVDFNQAGSTGSDDTFTGTFTVSGDGTSNNSLALTATNPSGSFAFAAFVVDVNTILLVSTDSSDVIEGVVSRQF